MSSSSWQRVLYPGLLLFALSLPLSKSASNILLVALWVAALAGAAFCKEFRDAVMRVCRQPLTAALALYCLVAYVGIFYTEKLADGFSVANKFISLPAIYFFVSVLLEAEPGGDARARKAESLLFSFLAGVTAANLLAVLIFLGAFGGEKYALPLAPLGMHHIWFSNVNALGLYTAASFLLFTRHGATARGRALLCGFLLLSFLCILLSSSRTAWFGIAVTGMIMAAVTIGSKRGILLVALITVLGFTSVYRFVPFVRDRVDLVADDIALFSAYKYSESSTGGRLLMWRAALLMAKDRPIFGVGTGDFVHHMKILRKAKQLPKFVMGLNQPHNIYLFSLATNGIVGLAALLLIFHRILRSVVPPVRSDGGDKLFAFLAMAAAVHFMIAGLMDSFFNIQVLRFSFALIMGVCVRGCASPPRR